MMGKEAPETCWATHKRQVINLWNCFILLVNLFESYDDARTCEHQIYKCQASFTPSISVCCVLLCIWFHSKICSGLKFFFPQTNGKIILTHCVRFNPFMFIFTLISCLKINNYSLYRYLATGRSFSVLFRGYLLRASVRDVVRGLDIWLAVHHSITYLLLPTWYTNLFFVYTYYIKLDSSTCFERTPPIIRRSTT
jgi:hypothetical protein